MKGYAITILLLFPIIILYFHIEGNSVSSNKSMCYTKIH